MSLQKAANETPGLILKRKSSSECVLWCLTRLCQRVLTSELLLPYVCVVLHTYAFIYETLWWFLTSQFISFVSILPFFRLSGFVLWLRWFWFIVQGTEQENIVIVLKTKLLNLNLSLSLSLLPLQVFKLKAVQLAEKLLPAFNTPTGIPWAIVNLKRSVIPENESRPLYPR